LNANVNSAAEAVNACALHAALGRWCSALEAAAPELNALDAKLGDGDLGTTLQRCASIARGVALPVVGDGLAPVLTAGAQACAKASGSSFGTLLAVAFLSAAKSCGEASSLDRGDLARVLAEVQAALCARGGAQPGDKTMIDSLQAIVLALRAAPANADAAMLAQAAKDAAQSALNAMRGQPNRIGRARMFAERSVGLDDPGMVAVLRMVQAL
jgi:dihydroxyacetone kinase-like protein